MIVEMSVKFSREEMFKLLKEEFRKHFSLPEGYELQCTDSYSGSWTVEMYKPEAKETKPAPAPELKPDGTPVQPYEQ